MALPAIDMVGCCKELCSFVAAASFVPLSLPILNGSKNSSSIATSGWLFDAHFSNITRAPVEAGIACCETCWLKHDLEHDGHGKQLLKAHQLGGGKDHALNRAIFLMMGKGKSWIGLQLD